MNEIGKWRLPTIQELKSIVDYTKCNPATNLEGIKPNFYWSSSPFVSDSYDAWGVYFKSGGGDFKYKRNSYYVRCVRTLQDKTLEWAKEDAPKTMTLQEAIEYASSLNTNQSYSSSEPKNPSKCCTKCGSEDLKTKYVDKNTEFLSLPNSHKGFIDSNNITTKEMLLRSCGNCEYKWCEDVIDIKDNND